MKVINKDQVKLDQIKVLIRLDLNVPLDKGEITDTNRIDKIIPTLKFLLSKKAKLILISHVGRPKGKWIKELSLSPICENISLKLNENVRLINEDVLTLNKNEIFKNSKESLVMLENIRFYIEEEENNPKFAQHLADLGDIYVNEAFSCSHRAHASVTEITKYLPCYAGIQLNSEVEALKKITSNVLKPITCIMGGSKISTKINVIKNLIPKFNNIIVVGGMANNILKFKGFNIGKSIYEKNCNDIVEQIFSLAKTNKCEIVYPKDVAIGKNLNDLSKIKNLDEIENDDLILDIGLKTINNIKSIIQKSKTILWNGPAGYFENENFAKGSYEIAKEISKSTKSENIYSVVGGGDTVALINKFNLYKDFNFVSTAGGAFLEFLEGKELPGIKSLN
ncbi:MAG: phosphoglycerate kinase [Candidatus Pelagibacter bacterium]|jgi:phosphoglycerate kinase|nr:phosphoglycerate kinase [Candidatus Pelagibacter bacterium]|tara:strand:+ start:957 stop:2138 length:1182 start_codon:yes stop_codon:yes gene_type:complete